MNTCGEGKYRVWLKKKEVGEDLVYLLGGGEEPHIGSVSICEPGETPESIELKDHYDKKVTEMIAKAGAKKHGRTVVCTGGVHVNDASEEDVQKLVENCKKLKKFV